MLTRLEVDGFKNLLRFEVDFGPFTCIAGANGVGKSNVFDAIRFLSLLADHTIMDAALLVRGDSGGAGDIRDLFWRDEYGTAGKFTIAAEMIVSPNIRDDFGRPAEATSTFLRYEVAVGYEESTHRGALSRLVLLSEKLNYITEGEAISRLRFAHSAKNFRAKVVVNKRRAKAGYVSSQEAPDGQTEIVVHQDGGSRGPGPIAPARSAPRTIVATSNTSATPTILAARREMLGWKFLALEPSAMRQPDRFQTDPHITPNGGHLPAALYRLATSSDELQRDPADVYQRVGNRLAELVSVSNLAVDVDEVRQLLTLQVKERSGVRLPAASLSDVTLRFLTLSVLVDDDQSDSLIALEEPENGIHPAKMPEMVRLLQDLAVDPNAEVGIGNPFRQVIVATHSPVFVQLQKAEDLLCAQEVRIRTEKAQPARTLRCLPQTSTWRSRGGEQSVGLASLIAYLTAPPGAQLKLPELDRSGTHEQ